MKAAVLKVVNDKLSAHAAKKEHSMDRKTLGRYVDKFIQDEYSEMKPNYVTLVLPGRVSKKAGQGDKKIGTVASKSRHKNT